MPPRGEDGGADPVGASSGLVDWEWVNSLDPKTIEEEDIARLVPVVTEWDPDGADGDNLTIMFKLVASALKIRDSDLNEAMEALGEKEAGSEFKEENRKLRKEIKDLKKENKELDKSLKRVQKIKSEGGGDEALEDLYAAEQALEQAQKETREMESELERERNAREDTEKRVESMKSENKQLKRDIEGLRDEMENLRSSKIGDDGSGALDESDEKRLRELEETVRMKNKQIHSLLEDIEQVEKDSVEYQNKVIELRDQMSETTKQMNAMTGEFVAMKESSAQFESLVTGLQNENERLRALVEEQLRDKKKRDEQFDEVGAEVEKRIDQMKQILDFKEATIDELRARLNRATVAGGGDPDGVGPGGVSATQNTQQNVALLTQALRERDEQIEQLQENLAQASKEIESSATLIEGFTNAAKGGKGGKAVDPVQKSLINVRGQLQKAEEKIKDLEDGLHEAEEAAKFKSEELSTAIAQLRAYEKGEYGLEKAVEEVRQARRSEKLKDQKIEELTNAANQYQYQVGELLEEVNEHRDRAGMEPFDMSKFNSMTNVGESTTIMRQISNNSGSLRKLQTQRQKDRALLQVMGREIERLEEERIQLKTENRKMARQLGHRAAELGLTPEDLRSIEDYKEALKAARRGLKDYESSEIIQKHDDFVSQQKDLENKEAEMVKLQNDLVEYKTRYDDMFEENAELRKGMKEILEDVKEQDGQSDVLIHSPALEKLISILDARHLWGNYHPAMGLKAQIDKLEGANAELREQIRKTRLEEDKLVSHLQRSKAKITALENELNTIRDNQLVQPSDSGGQPGGLRVAIRGLEPPAAQGALATSPSPHGMSSTSSDLVAKLNIQLIQVLDQLETKEESCKNLQNELDNQQSKLSVIRHQLGLLYEQCDQERKTQQNANNDLTEENKQLRENIEAMKAKVDEYEGHLDAFENGEMESKFADTTRKMVILRSNEALMIRRYRAIEESEKLLRKENRKQKEEMVNIENQVLEKIGFLQRHKDMATFKIESLQQAMSESVPSSSLEDANRQYAELTARYRHLLEKEQSHSANERRMEEMELVVNNLRQEKSTLNEELKAAREKLHSCEVMVSSLHGAASAATSVVGDESPSPVVAMVHDHQMESLAKQIATLEMKELNEKQRADHADNKQKLLQAQVGQLEKRNEELEQKFADVSKANLDLQRTERELRDELVTSIAREKFDKLEEKVKTLESKENELKIENDKLKEVADVAKNQIELLEHMKAAENVELEALRHEVIDLQSQTDEKSLIGNLHRQIVGFQVKETESNNKIRTMQGKIAHLEAQLFRVQQRADERDALAVQVRAQSYIKCKTLHKIIQDLRRQYSGSVPLSRQEKLSEILRELKEDKRLAAQRLREAEDKLQEAETRADDLAVRQDSVDSLMNALKQGAGTKQVVEWQKKLEELRLRELRSRRQSDRWSKEVDHLRELVTGQAKKIDQLEEELVRVENQVEQKQLDWETRQVELETLEDQGETEKAKERKRKEDAIMIPNPEWPLAKQLEQALSMIKAQSKTIEANKAKLGENKRSLEELQKKARDAENKVLAKDRIINDLRMQVPSSVDRAMAIASVTGSNGLPVSLTTDYESKQALAVAQSTVSSLRERLEQKEETVTRYEKLLKQVRSEYEEETKKKQDDIVALKSSIRSQSQLIYELKASAQSASSSIDQVQSSSEVIAEKMRRIVELEDEVLDLQTSLNEVSQQLANARNEADNLLRSVNAKQKELDEMKETYNVESQVKSNQTRQDIDKYSSEAKMLRRENALLQDELRTAKEALEKAPASVMSSLVEKLRADIAEKEKKQRAMGRIIADLKNELVNSAVAKEQRPERVSTSETTHHDDTEALEEANSKIEDLNFKNDSLTKQLDTLKAKQISSFGEIKSLKEELSKKNTLLVKLKEDKIKKPGGVLDSSPSRTSGDKEKDELRKTIRRLEDRLQAVNRPEKPLEEGLPASEESNEKQVRTAAELARWDESKKWLHKVEVLKSKLSDADGEVSKLSKTNKSLRDLVTRLEREKLMLETRAKSSSKTGHAQAAIVGIKVQELQKENEQLREEVEALKHNTLMHGSQGMETLRLKNKFLTDRVEAQERKITTLELTRRSGGDASMIVKKLEEAQEREKECQKQRHRLEEENMNLKLKLEQNKINDPKIKAAILALNSLLNEMDNDSAKEKLQLIVQDLSSEVQPGSGSELTVPKSSPKKTKEMRQLTDEVQKLKRMNEDLIGKLEEKNRELEAMRLSKPGPSSGPVPSTSSSVVLKQDDTGVLKYNVPNIDDVRRMEADLKRKSDLLTEVKVLLKQAADRERSILASKEELSKKLKLILDVDPKSPAEALAKELRQSRLTVERLQCEKKELEHKVEALQKELA